MTSPPPTTARPRRVRAVGDRALLVECADLADVLALHAALAAASLPGLVDAVAAARTVLVRAADRASRDRIARTLPDLPAAGRHDAARGLVTIDTVYDGEDLAAVAALTGQSRDAVVAAHAGQVWRAAFGGFAPGFTYLLGAGLDVPRRASPRTVVPAGAVALAGEFSAVYPRASPGGWQLIGRTDAPLWDLERDPPALVRPGDGVRFRAVRERVAATGAPRRPAVGPAPESAGSPPPDLPYGALLVLAAGPLSLLEDLGRPGRADLGVSPSGAVDRGSARQANRLVGNDRSAAVVETVLGGLELRTHGTQVVAVSGAPAPLTVLDGDGEPRGHPPTDAPFALRDGEVLRLGTPPYGLRSYVALRGGLAVPPVLGSRSTDVLAGLGPAPLAADTLLPVGAPPRAAVGLPEPGRVREGGLTRVTVLPGPRADWLTEGSLDRLGRQEWVVTDRSNRVGLRLDGLPLVRAVETELPSEGAVAGAVQVPADGRPVLFLADHPVTGGYPVVAVVRDADLDALAQVRPGERVRLGLARQAAARHPGV